MTAGNWRSWKPAGIIVQLPESYVDEWGLR